jgi:TonB family protein
MRRLRQSIQLPLFAAVLLFGPPASAQIESRKSTPILETNTWQVFSPAEGGFRILFPARPLEVFGTITIAAKPLKTHEYVSRTTSEYRVSYFALPVEMRNSAGMLLDGLGQAVINELEGSAVSETDFLLENHPGRLLELTTSKGAVVRTLFLAADNRLYRLTVTMPRDTPAGENERARVAATRFFESFSLAPVVASAAGNTSASAGHTFEVTDGEDLSQEPGNLAGATPGGNGVTAEPISLPAPRYPKDMNGPVASGAVNVKVLIDEEGKVIAAQVVSGHPLLRESALEAARKARFTPVLKAGKPAKARGTITYNFVFDPSPRIR